MPKKSGFESPKDWESFSSYLETRNRFMLKARWERFLKTLKQTAKQRTIHLDKNKIFVRARIGSQWEEYEGEDGTPHSYFGPLGRNEMGAPSKDQASEGRVNPRGIAYLYLSTEVHTAIAEVRPWIKAGISVGFWIIRKRLKILDVSLDKHRFFIGDFDLSTGERIERKYSEDEISKYVWGDINRAFSLPIQPGFEDKHYIPTQCIAEYFKNRGYQGIAYKSSVDEDGHNLVLFTPDDARMIGAKVFKVEKISYTYEESGQGYSISLPRKQARSKSTFSKS